MIIIVLYVFLIIIYGVIKKVNCYEAFKTGVSSNFKILLEIFPNLIALVFVVEVFINSGIIGLINNNLNNLLIPIELLIQMFLKPISSSSSMILMIDIFNKFGTDSSIGILSSIIQGCSDTTLYIVTMYFTYVHIKDYKYALKVGLLTDIITFIICCLIYLLIF